MTISLNPIGPNHNEVRTDTRTLVFSYSTLVAVQVYGDNAYRTSKYHSRTTTRHINKSGLEDAIPVSPEELARLAEG